MRDEVRRDLVDGWYRAYADRVMAYLLHRTDSGTAEDVLQEVFIAAYRRAERIREPVLSWLFGTARRVLSNARRSAVRQRTLTERIADDVAIETARGDAGSDRRAGVAAALADLSPADQEILTLSYWYGLSGAEAAAAVGCSARTYAVRLYRARQRLAERLPVHEVATRANSDLNHLTVLGRTPHA